MSSLAEKVPVSLHALPQPAQLHHQRRPSSRLASLKWTLGLVFASAVCYTFQPAAISVRALWAEPEIDTASLCPQVAALSPTKNTDLFETLDQEYKSDAFLQRAVALLGGAVRIPYVFLQYGVTAWASFVGVARNPTTTWGLSARTLDGRRLGPSTSTCSKHTLKRQFTPQHLIDTFNVTIVRSHTSLKLTKVNTYGLVYVWEGSDESLKPLLLAAHQGW